MKQVCASRAGLLTPSQCTWNGCRCILENERSLGNVCDLDEFKEGEARVHMYKEKDRLTSTLLPREHRPQREWETEDGDATPSAQFQCAESESCV